MIEYRIVEGFPDMVSDELNRLLSDGWDLHGFPMIRRTHGNDVLVQCLTKETPAPSISNKPPQGWRRKRRDRFAHDI